MAIPLFIIARRRFTRGAQPGVRWIAACENEMRPLLGSTVITKRMPATVNPACSLGPILSLDSSSPL